MDVPDHVFREYDIRGVVGKDLTTKFVYRLGRALGAFYRSEGVEAVALGRDARASSQAFRDELCRALAESGLRVEDIGLVPTPVLYFSLFNLDVAGGVMITGSHNPPDENGFKICLGNSTVYGPAIQGIREILERAEFASGDGACAAACVIPSYIDEIARDLSVRPHGRRIRAVVDAGNGTGNLVATELYARMGHEVVGLYSEPDGTFPHHHPDPTIPENLRDLVSQVSSEGAELGVAFDGDADRIGVVTPAGGILWGDQLLILFARDILAAHPGAKVIGEVKCSEALFQEVRKAGGEPIMWKVGHSLIKAKLKEERALLAGEMSGHLFFADRYYGYDDAIYAGARLLDLLSRSGDTLERMAASLPKVFNTPEIRAACPDPVKQAVVQQVAEAFRRDHEVNCVDGARIRFRHGWGLVRASNTQPAVVLRFEADSPHALEEIKGVVLERLKTVLHRVREPS